MHITLPIRAYVGAASLRACRLFGDGSALSPAIRSSEAAFSAFRCALLFFAAERGRNAPHAGIFAFSELPMLKIACKAKKEMIYFEKI